MTSSGLENSVKGVPRNVTSKSNAEIGYEWDRIADTRYEQIATGRDISYLQVLLPAAVRLSRKYGQVSAIDIGCGAGFVAKALSADFNDIVGVDLSVRNIELAQNFSYIWNING